MRNMLYTLFLPNSKYFATTCKPSQSRNNKPTSLINQYFFKLEKSFETFQENARFFTTLFYRSVIKNKIHLTLIIMRPFWLKARLQLWFTLSRAFSEIFSVSLEFSY